VKLLAEALGEYGVSATSLRVLDLGAGNGMVGQELRRLAVRELVGVDLIPEAAAAVQRDRPALYDDYLTLDLCQTDLRSLGRESLQSLNCLVCVAALGFGDIPTEAFVNALNAISTPGWMAFNIKESFLSGDDASGFSRLIRALSDERIIRIEAYRRYMHRLSISGKRLFYVAMTARKLREVPEDFLQSLE
jgi:predicted TPR repeat methyltransferase